jgi:hypothetical protein
MTDYRNYYSSNLEGYLLGPVRDGFQRNGFLSAMDFFCIVIWKANRAKSKIAKRLLDDSKCNSLDEVVRKLTEEISNAKTAEEKMRVLVEKWKFRLPMASAILTILYPEEFTVYDVRVAGALDEKNRTELDKLDYRTEFQSLWLGYKEFIGWVNKSAPPELPLRDKDRFLWGESFFLQLEKDIGENFSKTKPENV